MNIFRLSFVLFILKLSASKGFCIFKHFICILEDACGSVPKDKGALLHFGTPIELGLQLRLVLSHFSNCNPTPEPKGEGGYESAIAATKAMSWNYMTYILFSVSFTFKIILVNTCENENKHWTANIEHIYKLPR